MIFKNKLPEITFPSDYTVLDIETTGVSSLHSEIIEIGALCVRGGKVVDEFSHLVKPIRHIPPAITALTGISDETVKDADGIEYVLPEFLYFAGDDIIVGHNVGFDMRFIYDRALFIGTAFLNDTFDTMKISRKLHKDMKHHKLSDLAERYNIVNENAHRALSDCYTTHKALQFMKAEYEALVNASCDTKAETIRK